MPIDTLFAGMPAPITITEVGRMRLETISFFILVFLLVSQVVRWIWNSLARDFPRLPTLSYWRALGLMLLWGSLFVLVLAMISGARELMTPGAWKRDGATYKLAEGEQSTPKAELAEVTREGRKRKLSDLRMLLWTYALGHEGKFPPNREAPEIAPVFWETDHPSGMKFIYRPGLRTSDAAALLAIEPALFGEDRFGLFTNGEVRLVTPADIATAFGGKGKAP